MYLAIGGPREPRPISNCGVAEHCLICLGMPFPSITDEYAIVGVFVLILDLREQETATSV